MKFQFKILQYGKYFHEMQVKNQLTPRVAPASMLFYMLLLLRL